MQQFAPRGPIALDPRAFGLLFEVMAPPQSRTEDGVALVTVRGPIVSRAGGWCDSYEAILARVDAALAKMPRAIVLELDSPGGAAQGCIEASRALAAKCSAAKVPLYAFVEGQACSAAYALALAADEICLTPTSAVGSIGVWEMLASQAEHDAALGFSYRVISTGERKKDGNPHIPISDGAVAASQAAVEALGGLFFALVEERRGLPEAQARALDGAIAIGADAVMKQLADREVLSLSQLLETISAAARTSNNDPKVQTMDEIKKALQAVIDDKDKSDEEKAKAKAALAALEPPKDKPAEEPKDKPAEDAAAKAQAEATKALAEVHKMRAEMERREEETERASLLASRPDFAPELVASLKKAPMATVRDMVATLPRTVSPFAAAASVPITRGKEEGGASTRLPPEAKAELDARMGITKQETGVVVVGERQYFGAVVPKKA